jgi:hypothetical protein
LHRDDVCRLVEECPHLVEVPPAAEYDDVHFPALSTFRSRAMAMLAPPTQCERDRRLCAREDLAPLVERIHRRSVTSILVTAPTVA